MLDDLAYYDSHRSNTTVHILIMLLHQDLCGTASGTTELADVDAVHIPHSNPTYLRHVARGHLQQLLPKGHVLKEVAKATTRDEPIPEFLVL